MSKPLLTATNLVTKLFTDSGTVQAVDGVSLHIGHGEAVALVGESGCGKSMTALSLMRLVRPPGQIVSGSVNFDGADLLSLSEREMRAVRGGRLAMVFQDPMTFLNPLMRVGEQIVEAIMLHQRVGRSEARRTALEALERVGIPAAATVIEYFPHQLSGGMRQRVLIAMAISSKPTLLIADEPTTALDVTIQAQIMRLLAKLRGELSSSMLLITHDLGLVAEYCDRVYVMYAGRIVEEGDVYGIFANPRHPYTRALLSSTLSPDRRIEKLAPIDGQPPNLITPPPGCRFHPRCRERMARCSEEAPPNFDIAPGASARCWLYEEAARVGAP
ncbi:MAG: peptide ABC transporter ATP-binding protein [Alphaproteobacteria bacterium 64-6]|nr:ABC transporter ATP-binding protein [Hyphomicrobium sp.]OJU29172.1 MAG: peptide ABC transporter ATP-binding protein [Alphaproteobacteria bacterium 64-6]